MSDAVDMEWSYGHPAVWDERLESFGVNNWDYPFASMLATVLVSFGVKNVRDIYYATFCQLIFWGFGYKGPDGIYNALAGLQAGRGEWFYAAYPTLLDTYEGINDFRRTKGVTKKGIIRSGAWSLGFYLSRNRYL
jgi:hypothetical protein